MQFQPYLKLSSTPHVYSFCLEDVNWAFLRFILLLRMTLKRQPGTFRHQYSQHPLSFSTRLHLAINLPFPPKTTLYAMCLAFRWVRSLFCSVDSSCWRIAGYIDGTFSAHNTSAVVPRVATLSPSLFSPLTLWQTSLFLSSLQGDTISNRLMGFYLLCFHSRQSFWLAPTFIRPLMVWIPSNSKQQILDPNYLDTTRRFPYYLDLRSCARLQKQCLLRCLRTLNILIRYLPQQGLRQEYSFIITYPHVSSTQFKEVA